LTNEELLLRASVGGLRDIVATRIVRIAIGTFRRDVAEKPLNRFTQNLAWLITSQTPLNTKYGMSSSSGSFSSQNAKSYNGNISRTVSPMKLKFEAQAASRRC